MKEREYDDDIADKVVIIAIKDSGIGIDTKVFPESRKGELDSVYLYQRILLKRMAAKCGLKITKMIRTLLLALVYQLQHMLIMT